MISTHAAPRGSSRESRVEPGSPIAQLARRWLRLLPRGRALAAEDWRSRHLGITCFLWAHVPAVLLFGQAMGQGFDRVATEATAVGVLASLASISRLERSLRSVFAIVGLVLSSAVLVHLSGGLIELHFHYFVVVVVIALYQDWVPFLVAAALVVLQHGVFGALDPAGFYNHPDASANPWQWAGIHALFLGGSCVAVIINWRLHEAATSAGERAAQHAAERAEQLLLLQTASNTIARETDADAIMRKVVEVAAALNFAETSSFYRWDPDVGVLRCIAGYGHERDDRPVIHPGEGLAGRVFVEMHWQVENDHAPLHRQGPMLAKIGVPIIQGGAPLGVLVVSAAQDSVHLTEDNARLLALFGDQAGAALSKAMAFEQQRSAVEELERVNRAKSDFVSVVSHEFRTPLTGIQGFSEMIRDEDFTIEEIREFAQDINTDAKRLSRMITDVLDLDRMESGRVTLHPEEGVDLHEIIHGVVALAQPNAPHHRIVLNLDPLVPKLAADPDAATQVVTNLVSNAIKYSPDGGEILVGTNRGEEVVQVSVRDHGMGIPPDMLDKIFERYTRVETESARHIQGTGLGLPIVRQIVEMHGGRVWLDSELGAGSIFYFTLPLAPAPTRGEQVPTGGAAPNGKASLL